MKLDTVPLANSVHASREMGLRGVVIDVGMENEANPEMKRVHQDLQRAKRRRSSGLQRRNPLSSDYLSASDELNVTLRHFHFHIYFSRQTVCIAFGSVFRRVVVFLLILARYYSRSKDVSNSFFLLLFLFTC